MINRIKFTAFTLAEILITLSIIGVIASMTIPSLVQDTQDAQYKAAWKKAYSTISDAVKMQKLKEGQVNVTTVRNYMQVIQDCATNTKLPECVMDCPSGWGCNTKPTTTSIFITADGMRWGDFYSDKWCAVDVNGTKGPNKLNKDTFVFCIMTKEVRVIPGTAIGCGEGTTVYTPNAKDWLYK